MSTLRAREVDGRVEAISSKRVAAEPMLAELRGFATSTRCGAIACSARSRLAVSIKAICDTYFRSTSSTRAASRGSSPP